MSRALVLTLIALFVIASAAFADKVLVRVYFDDAAHMSEVLRNFEDVAGWGGKRYADIVVRSERVSELKALAPNHEILIHDIETHMREAGVLGVGGAYHTFEETYADMDSVATAFPSICQLDSIGASHEDRAIWALKISDNVGTTESEAKVLYLGCHHAREIISIEIPLYIMYWLVHNYGTDSLATYLVDNREIWIVPLMNPDGREYVEHTGDWRKNRRNNGDGSWGVDLNRNWGYMWGYDDTGSSPYTTSETYRGPSAFSEPETQTIRDLMLDYQFSTAISYHSHGELILYAWGYTYDLAPDYEVLHALADSMADLNGYAPGPGAGLYPTNGDSDDWMYGEQVAKDKVFSYTYEVGTAFYPSVAEMIPLCEENLEPSLLAAVYADNIFRILPPKAPTITPMADDADGNYTVAWTPDATDTSNPAVQFELTERIGPNRITDDVESGAVNYDRAGFTLNTSRYHSGATSFYGGHTNNRNATLTSKIALEVAADDTLFFWTYYAIESNWDYAYVEVSTDGGGRFYSIPGNITTTSNPNGNNFGHGITGSSGGWIEAIFPLGDRADSTVLVRFRYKTDSYVLEDGFYIDDMYPTQTFDSSAVLSSTIANTYYDVSGRPPMETYYYEVRAMDADQQWGNLSGREAITVTGAGIDDIVDDVRPAEFANPVRIGSDVRFSAPARAEGTVTVYDVRGRTVRTLDVSTSGAATWNLRDDRGSLVSPGIYFISLDPDRTGEGRKVIILK